jgi:hypothetical protein
MGPAFYILAILGCGEGESSCEQIATAGSSYESVDACNQASEGALMGHTDAAFPVVVAQCRRADQPASANQASEGALMGHTDAAFPVVVAQCRRADQPASAKLWADEVERPGPDVDAAIPRVERAAYKPARRVRG